MKEIKEWELKIIVRLPDDYTPVEARETMEMLTNLIDERMEGECALVSGYYTLITRYQK